MAADGTGDAAFKRALKDPAAVFATPEAVVRRADLSRERKIEILRSWELDTRELSVADDENMSGDESSSALLQQIRRALRSLGAADDHQTAPTKHGGA